MNRSSLYRLVVTGICAIVVLLSYLLVQQISTLIFIACVVFLFLSVNLYRLDYLHPAVAYILPWLMILIFSVIPISGHARPMEPITYAVLLATMFAWMLGCISAPPAATISVIGIHETEGPQIDEFRVGFRTTLTMAFIFLYAFAALNVALAGFVPLISLITTGVSRYEEFGVPTVYGAFLAFSNALGCVAFYVYTRTNRRIYLALFLSVLVMHLALVTRQNMLTLLIEAFVIRCMAVKRFSNVALLASIAVALVCFSLLGTLRSGDIKELIAVQPEYDWIPTSLIWLYSYSYFNVLNIDNMITASGAPFFDGYMWQTILPSIMRPNIDHGTYLEIESMTVSSYILPVYIDIGNWVVLWTAAVSLFTAASYRRAVSRRRFVDMANYGCLFFCALMSFFTDFWLYLPVISQLVFFPILSSMMFKPPQRMLLARAHA
jgi:oligosaccharide repeat unit polymerase